MLQSTFSSVETRRSWVVAAVALLIMGIAFGAPWITLVALKDIAAEVRGERSIPAFASALMWMGSGIGGILMGQIAERVGIRFTVIFGALMVAFGLALSSFGPSLPLYVGHGLFMGLIGIGGINAPFYVYVSRWFDRRRGSALALISSGAYLAGAVAARLCAVDRLCRLAPCNAPLRRIRTAPDRARGRARPGAATATGAASEETRGGRVEISAGLAA